MNYIYTMIAKNEDDAREKTLANFMRSKKNMKGEEIGKNEATISKIESVGNGRFKVTGEY